MMALFGQGQLVCSTSAGVLMLPLLVHRKHVLQGTTHMSLLFQAAKGHPEEFGCGGWRKGA